MTHYHHKTYKYVQKLQKTLYSQATIQTSIHKQARINMINILCPYGEVLRHRLWVVLQSVNCSAKMTYKYVDCNWTKLNIITSSFTSPFSIKRVKKKKLKTNSRLYLETANKAWLSDGDNAPNNSIVEGPGIQRLGTGMAGVCSIPECLAVRSTVVVQSLGWPTFSPYRQGTWMSNT